MSTVPNADTPAPANNAKTTLIQSPADLYVRPTAGGNASGDAFTPASQDVPGAGAYTPPAPAMPTNAGPNMGHGATQIVAQPDGTGHPSGDTSGGGTVGDSGPQGAGPGKGGR